MEESSQPKKPFQRRFGLTRYIVPHDSFQWYTQIIGVSTLVVLGVLGAGGWLFHQQLYEAIGLQVHGQVPTVVEQYKRMSIIGTGIVVLTATLYVTIVAGFLFHRVAGPVYRLKRHMQSIIDGDPEVKELKLRETDQLGDLVDTYNQLLYSQDLLEQKTIETALE